MHGIDGIEIRPLTELAELEEVEAVQQGIWDEATIHVNLLLSFIRNGATLIGAFKDGHLIGFVFGFLGVESTEAKRPAMANLKMASQRMAVLPEFRDQGIGYELKLAQREQAIRQGIRLITWTFDPLLSRNAYLNIRKLGAIVREYRRDYYGTRPAPQVSLGSSDRAIAEWWVTSSRVEQRLNGKRNGLALAQYLDAGATIINPAHKGADGYLEPGTQINVPSSQVILIEIPDNYPRMAESAPDLGRVWRAHNRELMQGALGSGFAVTDFVRGEQDGSAHCYYALTSYYEASPGGSFSSN